VVAGMHRSFASLRMTELDNERRRHKAQ
jgi:hypothetical protein